MSKNQPEAGPGDDVVPLDLHDAVLAVDQEFDDGPRIVVYCQTTVQSPSGWSIDVSGVNANEVKRVALALVQSTSGAPAGDVVHGDKYVVKGSPLAVGNGATVLALGRWNEFAESAPLDDLVRELALLRSRLDANDIQQAELIGAFANAERAVLRGNDGPSVIAWLRKAGKAGLKFAGEVGTSVVTEAIKAAMGLK
jgi:hypothetical protein